MVLTKKDYVRLTVNTEKSTTDSFSSKITICFKENPEVFLKLYSRSGNKIEMKMFLRKIGLTANDLTKISGVVYRNKKAFGAPINVDETLSDYVKDFWITEKKYNQLQDGELDIGKEDSHTHTHTRKLWIMLDWSSICDQTWRQKQNPKNKLDMIWVNGKC